MRTPAEALHELLQPDDRVLILGGSGWFGRECAKLLSGLGITFLATSSDGRQIVLPSLSYSTCIWSEALIESFRPTIVIDFAFLTREKIASLGDETYVKINRENMYRADYSFLFETVHTVLSTSSGAVLNQSNALLGGDTPPKDLYGFLKAEAEERFHALASNRQIRGVIMRPWSVSGPFVTRPMDYMFSNFVRQVGSGEIHVLANKRVYRRFVSIQDLIAVSLLSAGDSSVYILDSGGETVEAGDLALKIIEILNPGATILRSADESLKPDMYFSDGVSWNRALARLNLKAKTLSDQILEVGLALN